MFGKEKKQQKAAAELKAREEAEYEAKYNAKQERKKLEKTVTQIDAMLEKLFERAALAKQKGYDDSYRTCVTMIKVARARKRQAETFMFQIDTMLEMHELSQSSAQLLSSMNTVMSSLGKLSLDKTVVVNSQRDFATVQRELDKQTDSIEHMLGGLEMAAPEESDFGFSDSSIEADIQSYMAGSTVAVDNSSGISQESVDSSLADLQRMLSSN